MSLPALHIGELTARIPIIQGGMGIGISLSGLAGAVAKEGGIGVISAAQPGFDEPDFRTNTIAANCRALARHLKKARETAPDGIIGVNIMTKGYNYEVYAKCAVETEQTLSFRCRSSRRSPRMCRRFEHQNSTHYRFTQSVPRPVEIMGQAPPHDSRSGCHRRSESGRPFGLHP